MYARMKELWHNSTVNNDQQLHLCCSGKHLSGKKRKEKTTPFGVNLMRSQILYQAAQTCQPVPDSDLLWATVAHCQVQIDRCLQLQQRWMSDPVSACVSLQEVACVRVDKETRVFKHTCVCMCTPVFTGTLQGVCT